MQWILYGYFCRIYNFFFFPKKDLNYICPYFLPLYWGLPCASSKQQVMRERRKISALDWSATGYHIRDLDLEFRISIVVPSSVHSFGARQKSIHGSVTGMLVHVHTHIHFQTLTLILSLSLSLSLHTQEHRSCKWHYINLKTNTCTYIT